MRTPAPEELARIEEALRQGRKIDAIKLYRECTGAGLAEAKAAVEIMQAKLQPGPSTLLKPGESLAEVEDALFQGKKIQAIKLYRKATDAGLAEAKMAVERIERELRFKSPNKFLSDSPDEGCLGVVVLFCIIVVAAVLWFAKR